MAHLDTYHGYGEELEKRLRLKTFPLALKLLKTEEDIPERGKRPMADFGHHLSLCQGFHLSRREGTTIAMLKKDMWCPEPVIGYGLGEAPRYFEEGHNRYPKDVETLEAGSHYAQEFPRLKTGRYVGIASAPLSTVGFEPDLIMIYCDSAQLCVLMLAREFKDGYGLQCTLSGHAACVYAVVPAIESGKCQVAVPCRGDRYRAMAADEEMIFTVPKEKLGDLMMGLRQIEKGGTKLPHGHSVQPEYPLLESYQKIAKMMGYI